MPENTVTTTSTLYKIITKVRRLTRSPSMSQISDAEITDYVNTFVLYDFPEHLRLFNLRDTVTWYCTSNVDTYLTDSTTPTDPLYNFKNLYTSVYPPVYIAGYNAFYSQSPEQFYGLYPRLNQISQIAVGNGLTTTFTGTLPSIPVLRNQVSFSSTDINGNGLVLTDDGAGNLVIPNGINTVPLSTINYITGAYVLNFATAPAIGVAINAQVVPYIAGRPVSLLYFDGRFTLRPVPDQPYRIEMYVHKRPAELLNANQMPELSEWWQYIAYGTAKKIFEDRLDMDSIQLIMPEMQIQESLILRRTIMLNSNERAATIYTEGTNLGLNNNGYGWGPW